jgi:hypothetical protein
MKTTFYKDDKGNLWHYEGLDGEYHQMSVVEEEDGQYIDIGLTPFQFTDEELAKFTKIEVEV